MAGRAVYTKLAGSIGAVAAKSILYGGGEFLEDAYMYPDNTESSKQLRPGLFDQSLKTALLNIDAAARDKRVQYSVEIRQNDNGKSFLAVKDARKSYSEENHYSVEKGGSLLAYDGFVGQYGSPPFKIARVVTSLYTEGSEGRKAGQEEFNF